MALFVFIISIIITCFQCLLGSKNLDNEASNELEILPSIMSEGHYFGLYEVEDILNITCNFYNKLNISNIELDWIFPSRTLKRQNRVIHRSSPNSVNLVIKNLTENDSGEYKCAAKNLWNTERSIGINVKAKKGECSDTMFQCSLKMCIHKRFTCDGFKDCRQGEDESSNYCGPGNPCDNKLRCPDGRCIPYTWCCDSEREQNCTTKVKHSCCIHMEKLTRDIDSDLDFQYEQHKFNDIGFLQTTVYTVIGCAMAFMFIVTIIVIAICRVHMRRSLFSRCSTSNNRNITMVRDVQGSQFNCLPFYDLDVYFNRPGCNDLMSINPLLVTYNINNGVQFVGRPIDPPPYCEVVTSPPKEGPPPPYASRENLRNGGKNAQSNEPETTESDSLLPNRQTVFNLINCNAVREESGRTEDAALRSSNRNNKYISKGILCKNKSNSQCVILTNVGKSDSSNNDALNLLLHDCTFGAISTRIQKMQTDQSNSYVSSDADDTCQ